MGAADRDADDRIDLEEAYRYAYDATRRATSRTWAGTQHPTFRFELSGNAGVVLTQPRKTARRAELVFPEDRDYLVMRGGAGGPVVAEVVAGARMRRISVRPERYFVRGRARDYILEGELRVAPGETRFLADDLLERVEYARLVRKGGGGVRSANGPLGGYTLRGPLANGTHTCHGMFAGYAFAFPSLTLTPRLDACASGFDNPEIRAAFYEVGGDVRVSHAWDFPVVTLDLGFAVGASWLRQSFRTRGVAPARDSFAARSSIGPSATFDVGGGLYLIVDLAAETYAFVLERSETGQSELTPSLTFRGRAGLGKLW